MLVDLTPLGVSGKEAEGWLDLAQITVNKNGIPFDQKSPFVTSGVRIGSPAVTSRGMKEKEMEKIGDFVCTILKSGGEKNKIDEIAKKVQSLCEDFPIYN
jgi:glycine hydroxymethyltransferase